MKTVIVSGLATVIDFGTVHSFGSAPVAISYPELKIGVSFNVEKDSINTRSRVRYQAICNSVVITAYNITGSISSEKPEKIGTWTVAGKATKSLYLAYTIFSEPDSEVFTVIYTLFSGEPTDGFKVESEDNDG